MYDLMNFLDRFLNRITMYRLVILCLWTLVAFAFAFSFLGWIFFKPMGLFISLGVALVSCILLNFFLAKITKRPVNIESAFITGLILFFVMSASGSMEDLQALGLASVLAIGSKYILAFHNKHAFNPAAFGAFAAGLVFPGFALWWVGSIYFLPLCLIATVLIFRKLRRFHLFFGFMIASLIGVAVFSFYESLNFLEHLSVTLKSWPLFFFAAFMVSEPGTTPSGKRHQVAYGVIVGVLASFPFHVGPVFGSPELALILGNVYSYIFSLKSKLKLTLHEKKEIGRDIYEFIFHTNHRFSYEAGQYLQWVLPHKTQDSRGTRRYFTIASSPKEEFVRLGVKFNSPSSSFKKKLKSMKKGDSLYAGPLDGDFVLSESAKKVTFIAGGIGITPFVGMLRFLMEEPDSPEITFFNCNSRERDVSYLDLLKTAEAELGMNLIHVLSRDEGPYSLKNVEKGRLTSKMVKRHLADLQDQVFYISGPISMVNAYKKMLKDLGVKKKNILTDYFPGFA